MPFELFANSEKVEAFIEKEAAKWNLELEPRPGHWDRRIEVKTPLQEPGLYVVTASFDGGKQIARCLFWIQKHGPCAFADWRAGRLFLGRRHFRGTPFQYQRGIFWITADRCAGR